MCSMVLGVISCTGRGKSKCGGGGDVSKDSSSTNYSDNDSVSIELPTICKGGTTQPVAIQLNRMVAIFNKLRGDPKEQVFFGAALSLILCLVVHMIPVPIMRGRLQALAYKGVFASAAVGFGYAWC